MASLSFEAETHGEIVAKVRRWLASVDGEEEQRTPVEAIVAGAELTKDALRILASAAPGPIAESDLVKSLTALGYQATDATAKAAIDALDALSQATEGSVVKRVRDAGAKAAFEMNTAMAKQLLKALRNK